MVRSSISTNSFFSFSQSSDSSLKIEQVCFSNIAFSPFSQCIYVDGNTADGFVHFPTLDLNLTQTACWWKWHLLIVEDRWTLHSQCNLFTSHDSWRKPAHLPKKKRRIPLHFLGRNILKNAEKHYSNLLFSKCYICMSFISGWPWWILWGLIINCAGKKKQKNESNDDVWARAGVFCLFF